MSKADVFAWERGFLTVGGSETFLLFVQGFGLREFAAFELFDDEEAFAAYVRDFVQPTVDVARRHGMGLLLDALVWRASPDWLATLGYAASDLARVNARAVESMQRYVASVRGPGRDVPLVVVGELGPRGDGYTLDADTRLGAGQAADYHRPQLAALAQAGVDAVGALTMTSVDETVGIVRAADELDLPVFASPTVETDGRLPDGSTLAEFIERVDEATDGAPTFYQVNCAHPTHLMPTLDAARREDAPWLRRLKGFRANASSMSHEELDNAEELDAGDPADLGDRVARMRAEFDLNVVGGCCGTDARHIEAIAAACT